MLCVWQIMFGNMYWEYTYMLVHLTESFGQINTQERNLCESFLDCPPITDPTTFGNDLQTH